MRGVRIHSRIFRLTLRSWVRSKLRHACWVMVEAPVRCPPGRSAFKPGAQHAEVVQPLVPVEVRVLRGQEGVAHVARQERRVHQRPTLEEVLGAHAAVRAEDFGDLRRPVVPQRLHRGEASAEIEVGATSGEEAQQEQPHRHQRGERAASAGQRGAAGDGRFGWAGWKPLLRRKRLAARRRNASRGPPLGGGPLRPATLLAPRGGCLGRRQSRCPSPRPRLALGPRRRLA